MRRSHLAVLVCVSLAASALLLIVAVVNEERPLEVGPGEVDDLELGTLVAVEGVIADGGPKDLDGSALVTLVGPGGASVKVFLAFPPDDLGPGDTVRVEGTVQLYKGSVEVLVQNRKDLRVLSKEARPRVALADLVGEPWRYATVEPRTCVTVACAPVAAGPGDGWWCVVRGPAGGPAVAVFLGPGLDVSALTEGDRLELSVRVRHDAAIGLVYLEVLGWVASRGT